MRNPSTTDRQTFAACLMLCEPLFEAFKRERKPSELWDSDHGMRLWVEAIDRHHRNFKEMPNEKVMAMTVKTLYSKAEWAQEYNEETPQHILLLQGGMTMARKMVNDPPEQVEQVGMRLLRDMQRYYLAAEMVHRITRGDDLNELVKNSGRELVRIESQVSSRHKIPFPNGGLPERRISFEPTGIDFLDEICGGGLMSGEVIGHAAPIGAGKTTLILQIAWERAFRLWSRYSFLESEDIPWQALPMIYAFFYENVENLYANFISHAANISRDVSLRFNIERDEELLSSRARGDHKAYELQEVGQLYEGVPPGELDRFRTVANITNNLIRFVDLSGADSDLLDVAEQGVPGIARFIHESQQINDNRGVDIVFVDYVGIMADIGMAAGNFRSSERHNVIRSVPGQLGIQVANPFRCPVWAAHQLNSEQNDQRGGTIPKPNRTDGSHMFLETCATGFASGRLNDDNVAVFVSGKNRRSVRPNPVVASLRRDYARWQSADQTHVIQDGEVMRKSERALQAKTRLPPRSGFVTEGLT